MRWVLTALTLLSIGAVWAVASPQAPSNCTKVGTNERNVLAGTPNRDVICALANDDYVAGLGGGDVLRGDAGKDTIVGGPGADKLLGSNGRDNLFAVDGKPTDVVIGGRGQDRCFADPGDKVRGCEVVFRGASLATAKGLSSAFGGQAVTAEELISTTPSPLPPPTVTVTVPGNCGGHPAPPPIC